jgi:hypothetical protein
MYRVEDGAAGRSFLGFFGGFRNAARGLAQLSRQNAQPLPRRRVLRPESQDGSGHFFCVQEK